MSHDAQPDFSLSSFDLSGCTALVTGPGRGIGRAIALGLAAAGADIAGIYRSTVDEVRDEVEALDRRFLPLQLDLVSAQPDELARAVTTTRDHFGRLDILVNNAGIGRRSPAVDYAVEDWQAVIQVNLNAVFYLSQAAARVMMTQEPRRGSRGKIVQIASLLAHQGGIYVPAYAAAKHGVAGLTKALANEWSAQSINVNAITPGYIATDLTRPLQDDSGRNNEILSRIPAGRWGDPMDLAGAAVFLASPAANYIHGADLAVDGGWLAR